MQLQLTHQSWQQHGCVYLQGCCYEANQLCPLSEVASRLAVCESVNQVVACLQPLRGEFSVIIQKNNLQCIAVTHHRLYPLYYRKIGGRWHVSDRASCLFQAGDELDNATSKQYFYTGAPFAGHTLVKGLAQCKPACVTQLHDNQAISTPFYTFFTPAITDNSSLSLAQQFEQVLRLIFGRVKQYVGDRQVVVPLSGGYDSRLIVAYLHQMGVKNLLCYTVGTNDESEQGIAHQVASKLGVPLYHVDYRNPVYRMQQFGSELFMRFVDDMGNAGNFMWLFEYNAILWLRQQGVLQPDAVFIPGHVGDFFAGSHLQKLGIRQTDSVNDLQQKLLLHAFEYGKPYFDKAFCADLKRALCKLGGGVDAASVVALRFILQNRLAHQILNSARVYPLLGYEVLLPLCDVDFIQFFMRLPYAEWSNVSFYQQYLMQYVFEPLQIAFAKPNVAKQLPKQRLKNRIKKWLPRKVYLRIRKYQDTTTETYLLTEMLTELTGKPPVRAMQKYVSGNEVMLHWYYKQLKQQLLNFSV